MIRVLHYIGKLEYGGSQSFVMEMYRKINREKIQFSFVTFPDQKVGFYDEIIDLGGIVYECPQYNGRNHILFVRWWEQFFSEHPEYKILHGHVRSVASIYIPIAKKHGVITIAHSHSTSNGKGVTAVIKNILQYSVRFQADYLFACSTEAGRWMYGKRAVKKDNYKFIPNGIDIRRFCYNPIERAQVREELGLAGKKIIGHIGRATAPKNHSFLLDVMKEVLKRDKSILLLIVGDGELLERIKQKARELDIADNVIFTGARNDADRIYSAIDTFVFPSLWEGLPISVVEAQANGLNCLVSDRVTSDVKLTDSVHYVPLEKGPAYWADCVIDLLKCERKAADNEAIKALQKFECYNVAEDMQRFYLQCMGEGV